MCTVVGIVDGSCRSCRPENAKLKIHCETFPRWFMMFFVAVDMLIALCMQF